MISLKLSFISLSHHHHHSWLHFDGALLIDAGQIICYLSLALSFYSINGKYKGAEVSIHLMSILWHIFCASLWLPSSIVSTTACIPMVAALGRS